MSSSASSVPTQGMLPSHLEEDFSVVIGGPLYQALRRAHLTGDALELMRRRIVVIAVIVWVPLLVLSALDGKAWGGGVAVPFLHDIDTHVRLLVALPLLIVAELVVHQRMRKIVGQFVSLGLVRDSVRPRFDAAIESAMRLRNSMLAETLLIALVYVVGIFVIWRHYFALGTQTWYATQQDGALRLEVAGWWYLLVSLPLFQFVWLRWYFRLFVWARFLWHVSRIEIAYSPMHPDRSGGIGFLSRIGYAFAPLLLAQGALLAGTIANRIFFDGAALTEFKLLIFTFVATVIAAVLAPLLVFIVPLSRAKRAALTEYGHLSKRYVDEFEAKWLRSSGTSEPFVGSADVQSLADLANSFEIVRGMRIVPIARETLVQLAVLTLLPLAPLLLTMISLEELLGRLIKVVI